MKPFRTALVLSLTNPKAILFYVAFFSQFINPEFEHPWISYLVMASILEAFSICWMSTLALSGAAIQRFVSGSPLMSKVGNTLARESVPRVRGEARGALIGFVVCLFFFCVCCI